MKYRYKLSKSVQKFLSKREDTFIEKFYLLMGIIQSSPFGKTHSIDIKRIQGKKNHFRLRIGKYRFLYEIIDEEILIYVYEADSRGSIY